MLRFVDKDAKARFQMAQYVCYAVVAGEAIGLVLGLVRRRLAGL